MAYQFKKILKEMFLNCVERLSDQTVTRLMWISGTLIFGPLILITLAVMLAALFAAGWFGLGLVIFLSIAVFWAIMSAEKGARDRLRLEEELEDLNAK